MRSNARTRATRPTGTREPLPASRCGWPWSSPTARSRRAGTPGSNVRSASWTANRSLSNRAGSNSHCSGLRVERGRFEEAAQHATAGQEIGRRLADRDLQAFALVLQGASLVFQSQVEQGLSMVDEGTLAALGGDVAPYIAGNIYCVTISVCRGLADYRRAGEWTEAARTMVRASIDHRVSGDLLGSTRRDHAFARCARRGRTRGAESAGGARGVRQIPAGGRRRRAGRGGPSASGRSRGGCAGVRARASARP